MNVTELKSHPLVSHNLSVLRDVKSSSKLFRDSVNRLSFFVFISATANLKTKPVQVETPLKRTREEIVDGNIWFIPILRAGLGMLDAGLHLIPEAHVGFIGFFRDETSLSPEHYYTNLPDFKPSKDTCFILDPMLATGGSSTAAIDALKERGASDIYLLTLISAPEGLKVVSDKHADVPIITASIDDGLNDAGYILPGLGDAGDRYFGS